ncbi:MAG: serine hydrolase [Gemmatimonadota bacterium]
MSCRGLALLVALLATPLAAQQPDIPPDLDAFVQGVMADNGVPGLALTIVKDGKVLVAKGYGVRELGKPTPVDDATIFGIASNSKFFTATALAMLVEEGKLAWDAPVINYLPGFRLSDAWVTSQITIRDLLVHRSGLGLGAGDLLWWPGTDYSRQEIVRRLRFIPLATSFRSAYAYDNVLYTVAGEVIQAVSGRTWEQFIAERILQPLGMADSRVGHSGAAGGGNVATPHDRIDGVVQPIAPFATDNVNPAGGINASARDMAKWMIMQLDSGRVAGRAPLFGLRSSRELTAIVTPLGTSTNTGEFAPLSTRFNGYALGMNVRDYRGAKLFTHTGGLPGYISRVAMMPELNLGVSVLTNHESSAMDPIVWQILDHYVGGSTDWRSAYRTANARNDSMTAAAATRTSAARDSTARPSLPLTRYAGHYADAWYGGVDIAVESGKLVIRFSHTLRLVGDLIPWQYETFTVRWRDRGLHADAFLTFTLDPRGRVAEARMAPASPSVDFSFDFEDLLLSRAAP